MKITLIVLPLFYSVHCLAQSDSKPRESKFRIWLYPTQAITGQYTLAFSWRIHRGIDWCEVGAGYRYFPYGTQNTGSAPGGVLATPDYGLRFFGPSLSFSYDQYYVKIKKRIKQTLSNDSLQTMISNSKPRNSIRYEVQYQYLEHDPVCYYKGEEKYSYTYSASKHCLTGKILWSRIFVSNDHHELAETYLGFGLQIGYGTKIQYVDTSAQGYPGKYDFCVSDVNAPTVTRNSQVLAYGLPLILLGIRFGFQ